MIARSPDTAALLEERLFEPDIARSQRGEPPSGVATRSRAGSGTSSPTSCEVPCPRDRKDRDNHRT